ncbi:hypothetical protein DYB32_009632 [Aphanomyces invadans]|uniref:Uncharacterized protein n=1 Tax=Aphanomyces invadans TaxID=157072 RepID=A0A418AI36_9STRA|nr:hypothetical protein DYB32_009632 [Aphanomyces invadans]
MSLAQVKANGSHIALALPNAEFLESEHARRGPVRIDWQVLTQKWQTLLKAKRCRRYVSKPQRYKTFGTIDWPIVPKKHGNMTNKNATSVDYTTFKEWFYPYATSIGHTVPARRKTRVKTDGHIQVLYRTDNLIVLPPSITYEKLHQDYLAHLISLSGPTDAGQPRSRLPSEKTFRDYIKKSFPDMRLEEGLP